MSFVGQCQTRMVMMTDVAHSLPSGLYYRYLIVKEDKTLESYALNASEYCVDEQKNDENSTTVGRDLTISPLFCFHSLHSLRLRGPLVS